MLQWTLIFFVLALVAGVLGFTAMAGPAAVVGQILSAIFLALLIISIFANTAGPSN